MWVERYNRALTVVTLVLGRFKTFLAFAEGLNAKAGFAGVVVRIAAVCVSWFQEHKGTGWGGAF